MTSIPYPNLPDADPQDIDRRIKGVRTRISDMKSLLSNMSGAPIYPNPFAPIDWENVPANEFVRIDQGLALRVDHSSTDADLKICLLWPDLWGVRYIVPICFSGIFRIRRTKVQIPLNISNAAEVKNSVAPKIIFYDKPVYSSGLLPTTLLFEDNVNFISELSSPGDFAVPLNIKLGAAQSYAQGPGSTNAFSMLISSSYEPAVGMAMYSLNSLPADLKKLYMLKMYADLI